ncbi:tRNA-dependent cyclodipeptide synthase [Kitasatospora sp. NPDC054939]
MRRTPLGENHADTTPEPPAPVEFEALPFSDRCRRIWRRGDHLLIGVSPGNSYFSHRRISPAVPDAACEEERGYSA